MDRKMFEKLFDAVVNEYRYQNDIVQGLSHLGFSCEFTKASPLEKEIVALLDEEGNDDIEVSQCIYEIAEWGNVNINGKQAYCGDDVWVYLHE